MSLDAARKVIAPPNKPLLPTVRAASLLSAARPAADRQIVGRPALCQ